MIAVAVLALGLLFWLLQDGGPVTLSSASIDDETVELPAPDVEDTVAAAGRAVADGIGDAGDDAVPSAQAEGRAPATETPPTEPGGPAGPEFDLVRVEPGGGAQIAGRAAAGSDVVLQLDGVEVAPGVTGADGSFFLSAPLGGSDQPRALTVEGADGATGTVIVQPVIQTADIAAQLKPALPENEAGATPLAPSDVPEKGSEAVAANGSGGATPGGTSEAAASVAASSDRAGSPLSDQPFGRTAAGRTTKASQDASETARTDSGAGPEVATVGPASTAAGGAASIQSASTEVAGSSTSAAGTHARPDGAEPLAATVRATDDPTRRPTESARTELATSADPLSAQPVPESQAAEAPAGLVGPPSAPRPVATVADERPTDDEVTIETVAAPLPPKLVIADRNGVRLLQAPRLERSLELDTISYGEEGAVELAGRADASEAAAIRVYVDGRAVLEAPTAADGAWAGALSEVEPGTYTLRVDALGADGTVVRRVEMPFLRETPAAVASAGPAVVTVQPGNTLWGIARDTYGDGLLFVRVFEANRGAIRNPDLIYPGQIFDVPDPDVRRVPPQPRTP